MQTAVVCFVAIALFHRGGLCVPIKDEPETKVIVLQNEDMAPTVLDCDYTISDTDSFLTVKWFRNEKTIYQWIRGSHPAPIPEFKNDVDSSYESSTDPNKQYSSLALINPTIATTGDYKCVVQTKSETFTIHQKVQVIDVRNYTLNLHHNKIHNETQLECTVTNVFPKPTLTISSNDEDDGVGKSENYDPVENEDGYYNATSVMAVYDNDDDADSYQCVVSFEGYSQNLTKTATSGSSANGIHAIDSRLLWLSCFLCYLLSITKVII